MWYQGKLASTAPLSRTTVGLRSIERYPVTLVISTDMGLLPTS